MTGQNSARHRTTQFISPVGKNTGASGPEAWNWAGLTPTDVTLPRLLQHTGYRTIHIGKGHFAPPGHAGEDPSVLGFDVNIGGAAHGQPGSYWGQDGYGNLNPKRVNRAVPGLEKYHGTETFLTEALTIEAKAEIDTAVELDQPFFLYMSHYAVHSPFQADPRFSAHYKGSDKGASGEAFATLVEGMDKSLGDLMDHLTARGLAENTLILFMGDNGTAAPFGGADEILVASPLRGKKATSWEGGIRVPFVAAWARPDSTQVIQRRLPIPVGGVQAKLGVCYDVFPTILALTGGEAPDDHVVDGRDLRGLLTGGDAAERHDSFLSHFPHEHANSYFTSYRDGDWKVIYHYFPASGELTDRYKLFNLREDPSESTNLAVKEPRQLRVLAKAMIRELEEMNALYPVVSGVEQRPILPGI